MKRQRRISIGVNQGALTQLKRAISNKISTRLTEELRDQPEAFDRLVELGLIDPDLLDNPEELDLVETIRGFKDRISELAATEPSVLAQLEVRPFDVMRSDELQLTQAPRAALVEVPLTVVFSDLEGFTSFTAEQGDLEASALLTDHYDAVEAIAKSRGGKVVKKIGDGHMLSFSEPSAAVMASLDLTEAAPAPLRLRAGAHRGPVVRTSDDLLGHVVNVASRVTDLASGGMSLITREVRESAGGLPRIAYQHTRSERLQGVEEEIEVSEVVAS